MRLREKAKRLTFLAAAGIIAVLAVGVSAASADTSVVLGVHTEFDRTHHWRIEKFVDHNALTLEQGQTFGLGYTVKLTYLGYTDDNYRINDGINVEGGPFTVNALSDVDITANGVAANPLACSESWDPFVGLIFPFTGTFMACRYDFKVGDTLPALGGIGPVSVDVTLAGPSVVSGSGTYDFTDPDQINVFDKCVNVSDTFAGALGTVCVGDLGVTKAGDTKTWKYERIVSFADCGEHEVRNTASFVTNDTGATGSASVLVPVHIPCATGCTLTQGYWKTHSDRGPAPFDDAWNLVPNIYPPLSPPSVPSGLGESTPFYFSGQDWYSVFWTSASSGNAYYILSHQYMAAVLNILNGASSTSAVDSALLAARNYFNNAANTPTSALSLSKSARNTLLGYASTLDKYNNGLARGGPPHCNEDSHSSTSP